MQKLVIATKNQGKVGELREFLSDLPLELLSLTDVGITDDVEEDGDSYTVNSQKKALFYAQKSNLPAVADDSGLEIMALGGAPGIRSRRWIGEHATDEQLVEKMLQLAKELPKDNRQAFFKAVVSFALPTGEVWSVPGEVEGVITEKPHLKLVTGYPYRSFFFLPEINKYYHENDLTPEEQIKYNHRYIAIQKLKPILMKGLALPI